MDDQTADQIRELLLRVRDLEQTVEGLREEARRLIRVMLATRALDT